MARLWTEMPSKSEKRKTMEQKLIFLDIDGTLTLPGTLVIPESALEAVKAAQANGHKLVLCTGRCLGKFRPLLSLGFAGAVGSAGGYILCEGQVIYDAPMDNAARDRVVDTVSRAGLFPILETLHRAYASEMAMELLVRGKAANGSGSSSELARWQAEVRSPTGFFDLREYDGSPVYKVVFIGEDPTAVPKIEAELQDGFALCLHNIFQSSGLVHGELINRAFDKGKAVRKVCDYLQIPLENTISFGDSMNDLAMLKATQISVSMENSPRSLKAVSTFVCPSAAQNGLALAFRQLALI